MNKIIISALFLSFFSSSAFSEIRYIDDNIKIPLRSGASTEHRIINFLDSGTKVDQQYLNETDDSWAFVIVDGNKEGWVQVRYLRTTPAAKDLLVFSQQEVNKLKQVNKEHQETIKTLNIELKTIKKELDTLSKHSGNTDKELEHIKEISKNAIRLDNNNNQLLEENELLKASHEEAQQRVVMLENNQKTEGFIYGALAVFLGAILGWLLPKMRSRQNDGWV